jgi:hypothetical protein
MLSADGFPVPGLLSLGTLVGVLFGYGFGYIHAVWRRARLDYDTTRAAVPGLRGKKWVAWRTMVQRATLVSAALIGLAVWVIMSTG